MDFDNYSYDKELAESGRVIPLGGGASLTICRWGNKAFMAMYGDLMKPYGFANDQFGKFEAEVPEDVQLEIYYKVIGTTILTGWTEMTDDGEAIEYSPKNAAHIFKKHDEFLADVIKLAKDDATFKAQSMEAELEKPEPSLSTSSESAELPEND